MKFGQAVNSAWELAKRGGWLGFAVVLAGLWLWERDARVREQAALQAQRQATRVEVARLHEQAQADLKAANQRDAQAVERLKAKSERLMAREKKLEKSLAAIQASEAARVQAIERLPLSAVAAQLEARLGSDVEAWPKKGRAPKPSRRGGSNVGLRGQATRAITVAGRGPAATAGDDSQGSAPLSNILPQSGGASKKFLGSPAVALNPEGARKVDAAFAELDACRAERANQSQQSKTCAARAAADEEALEREKDAVQKLNAALQTKEQAWQAQQAETRAQLRAARGTFLGRLVRTTERVVIGVGIGVVIGVAAR